MYQWRMSMGDVVSIFSRKKTQPRLEIDMRLEPVDQYFNGYDQLSDKLQILAGKMAEELSEYPDGVPSELVSYNERLMRYIAAVHIDELDDGYASVTEFISDLVLWTEECVFGEDALQHQINQQYHHRLRVLK